MCYSSPFIVVPCYPWGMHSKTPSGCLKLWIVLNPIYSLFFPILVGMYYSRGPQSFWHQGPVSWKTVFPRMGGGGGMVQVAVRAMASGRWSFARLPLAFCYEARFLTAVVVRGPGVGDPCIIAYTAWICYTKGWFTSWARKSRMAWDFITTQDGAQFKMCELCISGIFHLLFLDPPVDHR